MDIQGLYAELETDPLGRGYAALGENNDNIWTSLTTKDRVDPVPGTHVSELTILKAFGASTGNPADGETCLQKLEAVGGANPLVKRALTWLKPGAPGLDMGDSLVRAMLDQLVTGGAITAGECAVLKGMAERVCSRLEEIGCGDMSKGEMIYLRTARSSARS
jgi:hypothetical protein